MTDQPPTAEIHLEHVLDRAAIIAIPLDAAKSLFADAITEVSVRSLALGQEAGRRQAVEGYENELEALRANGRELCATVAGQLRLIVKGMTSQPFDGSLEMTRLADDLDPPGERS